MSKRDPVLRKECWTRFVIHCSSVEHWCWRQVCNGKQEYRKTVPIKIPFKKCPNPSRLLIRRAYFQTLLQFAVTFGSRLYAWNQRLKTLSGSSNKLIVHIATCNRPWISFFLDLLTLHRRISQQGESFQHRRSFVYTVRTETRYS